ncbi:ROK family protein [Gloeocapsa sp. PCC 73106]|uniref:ROK family protein n=1 Tax=Gloeocapsa sp. PCC 73106 TaxID=102232 RepID=UPI0002AC3DD3|nr:ROK family protein [Gloeocapsa sp. PCC 73106]ELR99323.1 transcriptional regulator/sugar kinase [Gloeocapsa sp. PCC 73106]
MSLVIGIDLGGTNIKLGCYTSDGDCVESKTLSTPQPSTPERVTEAIATEINQLQSRPHCLGIGVGTPGPTDAKGRIAQVSINLANWVNVPLADWLESKTGLPTILANDANCAGLGEAWLGAGREFANFILLTLGTGVGGAIVLDHQLYTGPQGTGGELGLITINYAGPDCNSGNQGSLEQYVSIQGIRRATGKEPAVLAELARSGDREALEFWQDYGRLLGAGLASLIYVLTPDAIIIGGGISSSADLFFPATQAEIERRVLPSSRLGLQLLPALLGNQAGSIGAARLAWGEVDSCQSNLTK